MFKSFRKLFGSETALETEIRKRKSIERQFNAFMNNSPFPAWVKDSLGHHEYFNRAYEHKFGLPQKDWKGKTDFDLWPDEIAVRHREEDHKVLQTGEPITFQVQEPLSNGEFRFWFVVKFPFYLEENETCVGGIAVDISQQRKAESELDRFFEASSDMMCIGNSKLKLTRVNNACFEILGYTPDELYTRPLARLVHPHDRRKTEQARRAVQDQGRAVEFENRMRHKDGSYRTIAWNLPIPDSHTKAVYAVGRDITERRTLEKNLLQIADDEQNRIANDLHDGLGQELAGLSMMAQSLTNNLKAKSLPESELAEKIALQLEASVQLTRSLARGLRPVEIDSQGLGSALAGLADQTSERFGLECTLDSDAAIQVEDLELATQLYRIAQEAITNAAKHAKPSKIAIRLRETSEDFELLIEDNGTGFSEEHSGGQGIGLKSMQYRSDLIGGRLMIEAMPSGGTRVTCRLPRLDSEEFQEEDHV